MMHDSITQLISQVGFPIVVSVYLLTTVNKKLDRLVSAVYKVLGILLEKKREGD